MDTAVVEKIPLRQLAPGVKSSVKVLEIELERMNGHRQRMGKYQHAKDWIGLSREHAQSLKTTQSLRTNLAMMSKMRERINETNRKQFDAMVASAYGEALQIIVDVLQKQSLCDFVTTEIPASAEAQQLSPPKSLNPAGTENTCHTTCDSAKENNERENGEIHVVSVEDSSSDKQADEDDGGGWSWRTNVTTMFLSKKTATPFAAAVAGGLIGGVMLGPIGAAVGVKAAASMATVGSLFGFAGGHLVHEQGQEAYEDDLKKSLLDDKKQTSDSREQVDQTRVKVTGMSLGDHEIENVQSDEYPNKTTVQSSTDKCEKEEKFQNRSDEDKVTKQESQTKEMDTDRSKFIEDETQSSVSTASHASHSANVQNLPGDRELENEK